ncbi:MAG: hypothetical protein Q4D23_11865, partial [Bacteroidales bacterium]|nr:hypothetical protein [Bacteroidales bacterium]
MRKITYIILSLCLCTAGIGTAARMSTAQLFSDTLAAINDTIPDEEEDYFGEDEEEEEEEGEYDEEEDEEYD